MCISYNAIQSRLKDADIQGLPRLNISILRNIMVEPVEAYLRWLALEIGFAADIRFGGYDTIFQVAVGGDPCLLNFQTDCVLVFMKLEILAPRLARNFSALNPKDIEEEATCIIDHVTQVFRGIRSQTPAMILWHAFELPIYPSNGIFDAQAPFGQWEVVQVLNAKVRAVLAEHFNSYFVNTNICLARIGEKDFYDYRYWHIGRAPYTLAGLGELAREDFKYIRALKGKNKKCLVLDCDNTLWGGILGEDGFDGIKLDKTALGSPYNDFQTEIVNLYQRGIIIALCSKNNEKDVWKILDDHPEMVLRRKHIAAAQINWGNKADNIRRIAAELNIGLNSLVFVDDSEFELDLIRSELPEVVVLPFPRKTPGTAATMLASCGLFDTLTISDEDRKRGEMYLAEAGRRKLKQQVSDLSTFYRSLEMTISICKADAFAIPRIAQQTQKTNQFNLTMRRYSEEDVRMFIEAPDVDVFYLHLMDRFGDSGIVGTCILRRAEGAVVFDTFLLSCRVLGRGLEDFFVYAVLQHCKKRGDILAIGEYYASKMNAQVESFYNLQGFTEIEPKGATRAFKFDLTQELQPPRTFFKSITINM